VHPSPASWSKFLDTLIVCGERIYLSIYSPALFTAGAEAGGGWQGPGALLLTTPESFYFTSQTS